MNPKALFAALIALGYLATLGVSSWHLAEWYALTKGNLPSWLSFALAVTLEANAFILSLLSNSILRSSRWAHFGALMALLLVWLGNFLSMARAAPGLAVWEVAASSLFVPIGTYVMAKVMGELLFVSNSHTQAAVLSSQASPDFPQASFPPEPSPQLRLLNGESARAEGEVLQVLGVPRTVRELQALLPHLRDQLPALLTRLEAKGMAVVERGYWRAVEVNNPYGKDTA